MFGKVKYEIKYVNKKFAVAEVAFLIRSKNVMVTEFSVTPVTGHISCLLACLLMVV